MSEVLNLRCWRPLDGSRQVYKQWDELSECLNVRYDVKDLIINRQPMKYWSFCTAVVEMENWSTSFFGCCSSTVSLSVRPHCTNARRIRCQADLNNFPLGELEETTGTPPYYVYEDYPAGPGIIEPLPERSNWRGSKSSTLENDVYMFGTVHS